MKKSEVYSYVIVAMLDVLNDSPLSKDETVDILTTLCDQRSLELFTEEQNKCEGGGD